MIIAGIDEAGYGPLLGPLVVSCTAFEVPNEAPAAQSTELPINVQDLPCLWKLLKSGVVKKHGPTAKGRLMVADSKKVHALANGDGLLERGVLAFLALHEISVIADSTAHASAESPPQSPLLEPLRCIQTVLAALGCTDHGLHDHPWYHPPESPLPHWADAPALAIATNMLRTALAKSSARVAAMRTIVLSERRFNDLVGFTHNKGSALVSLTLRHLHWLHHRFGHQGLIVGIDKQGGRDHYTQLLLQTFPDATLKVLQEDDTGSSYRLMENIPMARHTIVHFREKGETHFLSTALASMICKYLREICMIRFNAWWCSRIEGLRPTAGYYLDGTRWLTDVTPHLPRLGVRREELVRIR